jgi:hypothetical protein
MACREVPQFGVPALKGSAVDLQEVALRVQEGDELVHAIQDDGGTPFVLQGVRGSTLSRRRRDFCFALLQCAHLLGRRLLAAGFCFIDLRCGLRLGAVRGPRGEPANGLIGDLLVARVATLIP